MNYALAREIYGNTPWMVDGQTFNTMFKLMNDFRNGVIFTETGNKLNDFFLYDTKSAVKVITNTGQLNQDAGGNDLVYVINLNGVITKNGGPSSYGTKELAQQMLKFDSDSRVLGGIILTDSGGGSSLGMQVFTHALSLRTKPVVGLVERGGMAASAAYGILSFTDYIMSESADSIVGSIGTMMSFSGHADKAIDGDGAKHVTMYATASTKKNKAYEEAINNDNYDLVISEILDPANERFIASIKANRPNVLASQLDGSTADSGDVIGTLVDEIGDFADAVNKVISLSSAQNTNLNPKNNIQNRIAMTALEIQQQHPETYNTIFAAGVSSERDRVGSWMAHSSTDLEEVKKGITAGTEITATARENFLVKASSATRLAALKNDSPKDVVPGEAESSAEDKADQTELNSIYGKFLNKKS